MFIPRGELEWLHEAVIAIMDSLKVIRRKIDRPTEKENEKMALVKLSSPWMELYHKVRAMFAEDNTVHVVFDEDEGCIVVYAQDDKKATALGILLNKEYIFGNVKVRVVVPAVNEQNEFKFHHNQEIYAFAFEGNPALSFVYASPLPIASDTCYVVFKNCVVQYFNDDLSDIHGNCSTLYQEIAKEIFNDTGLGPMNFCTDTPTEAEKLVKMCP